MNGMLRRISKSTVKEDDCVRTFRKEVDKAY
jgi:hypothetical protein